MPSRLAMITWLDDPTTPPGGSPPGVWPPQPPVGIWPPPGGPVFPAHPIAPGGPPPTPPPQKPDAPPTDATALPPDHVSPALQGAPPAPAWVPTVLGGQPCWVYLDIASG